MTDYFASVATLNALVQHGVLQSGSAAGLTEWVHGETVVAKHLIEPKGDGNKATFTWDVPALYFACFKEIERHADWKLSWEQRGWRLEWHTSKDVFGDTQWFTHKTHFGQLPDVLVETLNATATDPISD